MDIGTLTGQIELIDKMTAVIEKLDKVLTGFEASSRQASKGIEGLEKSMTSAATKGAFFGNIMANVTTKALGFLTQIPQKAFAAARETEMAMATMARSTGATGEELDALVESFKRVDRQVPESAQAVAQAIADISKRTKELGLSSEQIEDLTKKMLAFARVNQVDVTDAAKTVTTMMKASEIPMDRLAEVMDKLTYSSQQSGLSVTELAQGVIQGGVAFREMGFPLDKALALFTKFGQVGAKTSDVVHSVSNVMSKLAKEGITDMAAGLKNIFKQIETAGPKGSKEAFQAGIKLAEGFFGKGTGQARRLVEEIQFGTFDTADVEAALQRVGGLAERTGEQTTTFTERWALLGKQLDDVLEPLGRLMVEGFEQLIPHLENAMNSVESIGTQFGELKSVVDGLPAPIKAIGGAAVVASVGVWALNSALTALLAIPLIKWAIGVGRAFVTAAAAIVAPGWVGWAAELVVVRSAVVGLGVALAAAFKPAAIVVGIAIFVTSMYDLVQGISAAYDAWKRGELMWEFFTEKDEGNFVRTVLGWIGVLESLDAMMVSIRDTAQNVWTRIAEWIEYAAEKPLSKFIINLTSLIAKIAGWSFIAIGGVAWGILSGAITATWKVADVLATVLETVWEWFGKLYYGMDKGSPFSYVTDAVSYVIDKFQELKNWLESLGIAGKAFETLFITRAETRFGMLYKGVMLVIDGLKMLGPVMTGLANIVGGIFTAIFTQIEARFGKILEMIEWANKNVPKIPFLDPKEWANLLPSIKTQYADLGAMQGPEQQIEDVYRDLGEGPIGPEIKTAAEEEKEQEDIKLGQAKELEKYNEKVREMRVELLGGSESLKVFADAFKGLTAAQRGSFAVQEQTIPHIMKLIEAGKKLTPQMQEMLEHYQENRFWIREQDDALLESLPGIELRIMGMQKMGMTEVEIAHALGVHVDALDRLNKKTNEAAAISEANRARDAAAWKQWADKVQENALRAMNVVGEQAKVLEDVTNKHKLLVTTATRGQAEAQIEGITIALKKQIEQLERENKITDEIRKKLQAIADIEIGQIRLQEFIGKLEYIGRVVTDDTKRFKLMKDEIDKVFAGAGFSFDAILDMLLKFDVTGVIKRIIEQMRGAFETPTAWDGLKAGMTEAFQAIPGTLARAFEGGGDWAGAFKSIGSQMGAALGKGLSTMLGESLGLIGDQVAEGIGKSIGKMIPFIGEAIGSLLGPLMEKMYDDFTTSKGEDVARRIGRTWGTYITEEMGDQIAQLAEEEFRGNLQAAEIASLSDIIEKAGGLDLPPVTGMSIEGIEFSISNVEKFLPRLRDVFVMYAEGSMTAAQAIKVLDENWTDFLEASSDRTGNWSDQMKEMIDLAKQYGIMSKEMKIAEQQQVDIILGTSNQIIAASKGVFDQAKEAAKAVKDSGEAAKQAGASAAAAAGEQGRIVDRMRQIDKERAAAAAKFGATSAQVTKLDKEWDKLKTQQGAAAGAANAAAEAGDRHAEALRRQAEMAEGLKLELKDLGVVASGAFMIAIAAGKPFLVALQESKEGLKQLREAYTDLGLETEDPFLKMLFVQEQVLENAPHLITGITSLGAQLVAMDNLNVLNEESFEALGNTAFRMYTRLQGEVAKVGGTTKDALLPMQDYLANAAAKAKDLGIPLDANLQMLVDQSKELGIWKELAPSAAEKQQQATEKLTEAINRMITALGFIPDEIPNPFRNWTAPTVPAPGTPGAGAPPAAPPAVDPNAANQLNDVANNADAAAQAVDHLNYGYSPGGLAEIPILLAKGAEASKDFAGIAMGNIRNVFDVIESGPTTDPEGLIGHYEGDLDQAQAAFEEFMRRINDPAAWESGEFSRLFDKGAAASEDFADVATDSIKSVVDTTKLIPDAPFGTWKLDENAEAIHHMAGASRGLATDVGLIAPDPFLQWQAPEQAEDVGLLVDEIKLIPPEVTDPFVAWKPPDITKSADDLKRVEDNAVATARAVEILNYGASPGGLEDIALLLGLGATASEDFKTRAVPAIGAASETVHDITIGEGGLLGIPDLFLDAAVASETFANRAVTSIQRIIAEILALNLKLDETLAKLADVARGITGPGTGAPGVPTPPGGGPPQIIYRPQPPGAPPGGGTIGGRAVAATPAAPEGGVTAAAVASAITIPAAQHHYHFIHAPQDADENTILDIVTASLPEEARANARNHFGTRMRASLELG